VRCNADRPILKQLGLQVSGNGDGGGRRNGAHSYVLVTLHRPANVDESAALSEILSALEEIASQRPVFFPVHPRTRQKIEQNHLSVHAERAKLMEPLGYLDFLALMRHAALVITDSGGVQEETAYLSIPCLTIQPNTERPITIELGNNRLVERDRSSILKATRQSISGEKAPQRQVPPLWDGRAAVRIVDCLEQFST
jgi:UDP-N-acetylglucosamine 2-epimerase (non-hydrolysing)